MRVAQIGAALEKKKNSWDLEDQVTMEYLETLDKEGLITLVICGHFLRKHPLRKHICTGLLKGLGVDFHNALKEWPNERIINEILIKQNQEYSEFCRKMGVSIYEQWEEDKLLIKEMAEKTMNNLMCVIVDINDMLEAHGTKNEIYIEKTGCKKEAFNKVFKLFSLKG